MKRDTDSRPVLGGAEEQEGEEECIRVLEAIWIEASKKRKKRGRGGGGEYWGRRARGEACWKERRVTR